MATENDEASADLLRRSGLMKALGLPEGAALPVPFSPSDPQGVGFAASQRITSPLDQAATPGPSASRSGGPLPVQNMSIPAQGRALLATIGGPGFESNGSYTQRFNQPDFSDFSKHPATPGKITRGPNKGNVSDAAGRYQFLSTTYADQARKLNLTDFSPESQDKAAWNLAKETYAGKYKGRDLATDLQNPALLPKIASALHSTWTSLPGGIERSSSGMKGFANRFASNFKTEVARASTPRAPGPAAAPQPSPIDRLLLARAGSSA